MRAPRVAIAAPVATILPAGALAVDETAQMAPGLPAPVVLNGNGGDTWAWTPVTLDSTADNLRPVVPRAAGGLTFLHWLRGTCTSYTAYDQRLLAVELP